MNIRARTGRRIPRRRLVLPLVLVLAGALMTGPALASHHKSFTAEFEPPSVSGGVDERFTATLTNTSSQHQLGSANIRPPQDSDVTLKKVESVTVGGEFLPTPKVDDNTIELRNLAAEPETTIVVEFVADTGCVAGAYEWEVEAKQANNFRGPPGNDLMTDLERSELALEIGSCGELVFLTQPNHGEVNTPISGVVGGDAERHPVQVAVVDEDDVVIPIDGLAITAKLATDPTGDATLTGTKTEPTDEGVANFDDLAIDTVAVGYTLEASAAGFESVESDSFGIWEDIEACAADEICTANARRTRELDVTVSSTAKADSADSALLLSIFDDEIDCEASWNGEGDYPYNHASASSLYRPVGEFSGFTTVTLQIDRFEVRQAVNNGASFYQVCFVSDAPFTARDGHDAPKLDDDTLQALLGTDEIFGPALLPDCPPHPKDPEPPCVMSRTKTSGGDVLVEFAIPSRDPMFR